MKKLGRITLSSDFLAQELYPLLPEGSDIRGLEWDIRTNCFNIVAQHNSFPEVPEGNEIPVVFLRTMTTKPKIMFCLMECPNCNKSITLGSSESICQYCSSKIFVKIGLKYS